MMFYNTEIALREQLKYPPFCDIIVISFNGSNEADIKNKSDLVYRYLKDKLENKFKIFSDFYLPISFVKKINKEQEKVQKKYSLEEAKTVGIKELQEELDKEIENKENIVNKNINTYEQEDGVDIYVTYEVLENIGTNEKIVF